MHLVICLYDDEAPQFGGYVTTAGQVDAVNAATAAGNGGGMFFVPVEVPHQAAAGWLVECNRYGDWRACECVNDVYFGLEPAVEHYIHTELSRDDFPVLPTPELEGATFGYPVLSLGTEQLWYVDCER